MFAGHVGAGLVFARVERRVNAGAFIAAALLLDIILWSFVLLGRESVVFPADPARAHQPEFTFPLSHGLLASLMWSVVAGGLLFAATARLGAGSPAAARVRTRAAWLAGAAVFSHWLLDGLVHRPELPVVGSLRAGLGLWDHLPVALVVETGIVFFGMGVFMAGSDLPRGRSIGIAVLALLTLALTIVGMTAAPPPPSASAMATSSLITLGIVCALASWLGRVPRTQPA